MLQCTLLFMLSAVYAVQTVDYSESEAYKVYRIFPQSRQDVQSLTDLRNMSEENEIDFWLDSRQPGQFADVMVSPRARKLFLEFLKDRKLAYKVTIHNVEK
ncbi:zinc carboxypeptidase A 1-like protein [Aphelenchoides avenae]|nr:zinc carboxypeptidase A 1-like protein [Aphelenchus avenae]